MNFSFPLHFHFQPFGQGVDDGNPHSVQAAGKFVSFVIKFSARREGRSSPPPRQAVPLWMDPNGNPAPVVLTVTLLSSLTITSIVSQRPAKASSMLLSTTSHTKWCKPRLLVAPIYIPGRFGPPPAPPAPESVIHHNFSQRSPLSSPTP